MLQTTPGFLQIFGVKPFLVIPAVIAIAIISSNSILYSSKNQIKGLTTSVALWMCGIIGLTIGAGLYTVSVIGYAALICCLALFPTFEIDLKNRSNHFEVHLELKNREDLQRFITTMRTLGLKIDDIEANPAYINSGLSVYSVSLTVRQKDRTKYSSHKEMIEAINTLDLFTMRRKSTDSAQKKSGKRQTSPNFL